MNDEQRKFLALSARMEGRAAMAQRVGIPVKLSEMELIALCNFAEIGLLSILSEMNSESGAAVAADLDRHIEAVREGFASDDSNGLMVLANLCAALLRSDRYQKYLA